jgi:hypothetical protein
LKEKEIIPHKLVMAFDIAKAVQTPFPDPDMSSPSNNFANLSFIMSISKQNPPPKKEKMSTYQ